MKKKTKNKKKKGALKINDFVIIKQQYKAKISILALSHYWDIPYATLYRALKGRSKKKSL